MLTVGEQDVSRETYEELRYFAELVQKWTKKINLISPSTIIDIWNRHIVDSAQIYPLTTRDYQKWADIGSGGGFPGIVVAIIAKFDRPEASFVLIESDQRKATFLRTAIRELHLNACVATSRIEHAAPCMADVVSARALSSLSIMMPYLKQHMANDGVALLHKGKSYQAEIAQACQNWSFDLEEHRSMTDPDGRILAIKGIRRVG